MTSRSSRIGDYTAAALIHIVKSMPTNKLEKLSSIADRDQTDRVTALPRPNATDILTLGLDL